MIKQWVLTLKFMNGLYCFKHCYTFVKKNFKLSVRIDVMTSKFLIMDLKLRYLHIYFCPDYLRFTLQNFQAENRNIFLTSQEQKKVKKWADVFCKQQSAEIVMQSPQQEKVPRALYTLGLEWWRSNDIGRKHFVCFIWRYQRGDTF